MSTDDFLKFDTDKLDLNDFNFNISSTIPEHELMEFASFESPTDTGNNLHLHPDELHQINQTNQQQSQAQAQAQNLNINPSSLTHSINISNSHHSNNIKKNGFDDDEDDDEDGLTTKHLDPNQLIGSFNQDYLSPVGSPYSSNSFQPQSIQQSLSQSLQRPRHGSISNSISTSLRHDSIYDNLDSISSPQSHNLTDISSNPAYFSPAANKITPTSLRKGSISINSIASPGSYNDALSPYNSSFDPSSFKSPRSLGVSPVPGSSLTSQSLPKSQLTKDDKLKRRREFHNQVERRRRDLIKEKIKELGLIVPPSLLYVDGEGKEVKASKSVIINRTVDYVVHLHKVMKEQENRKAILSQKIEEIERKFGALTTYSTTTSVTNNNDNNPVNTNHPNSSTPQSIGYNNESAQGTNSSYNNSPIPDFKIEDEYNSGFTGDNAKLSEFDVNEFLKEHNQTWNHSNV